MRLSSTTYDDVDIDGSERNSITLNVLNDRNSNSTHDNNNYNVNGNNKLSDFLLPSIGRGFVKMEKGVTEVSKVMWNKNLVGLYAHYALVGFVQGIIIVFTKNILLILLVNIISSLGTAVGLSNNFCFYSFNGKSNTCLNATNIVNIPWSLKFFYAWCTDSYRPFGIIFIVIIIIIILIINIIIIINI